MVKLIIADDHKLARYGLQALLSQAEDLQIVGEAASGKEVITCLEQQPADVVLMDMDMPEMNGLQATLYIKEHFTQTNVLMLTMLEHEKYAIEALQAGALGYILKTADQEELLYAIRRVFLGEVYISSLISFKLLKKVQTQSTPILPSISPTDPDTTLSKRELEVLRMIAKGYTNSEIADQLFTSKRTVESHRQNILEKTGTKNTATLIMYAFKNHLLE